MIKGGAWPYETYHPKGLEMIGVSLDQDRMRLSGFVVQKKLAWPRFCDGGGWNNKLALQYGVTGLPANFLLDREGKVVAKNLRGKPLAEAVAKTLSGQGQ